MVPSFSLPFHMAYASDHINFHDGGRCHIETSPLICKANQWTGFYMTTTPVMKELIRTLNGPDLLLELVHVRKNREF